MSNTVVSNVDIANKVTPVLTTALRARTYATIDTSLTENEGMIKRIRTYTFTGAVEEEEEGSGNTTNASITYSDTDYTVKVAQQRFPYTDEEFMRDSYAIKTAINASVDAMIAYLNTKYFGEQGKIPYTMAKGYNSSTESIDYDLVADAKLLLNEEDAQGYFLLINPTSYTAFSKDDDFIAARQGEILFTGHIGSINGMPVVVCKLVPSNVAYIVSKKAVTIFIKKALEAETDREPNTRTNYAYLRMVNVVALTDTTKAVKIAPTIATPVITTAALVAGTNKEFKGTCAAGATIYVTENDVVIGTATVTTTNWTYNIETVTSGKTYSVIAYAANYAPAKPAAGIIAKQSKMKGVAIPPSPKGKIHMSTLDKMKTRLGIDDTSQDTKLASLIEDAEQEFMDYCNVDDVPEEVSNLIAKMAIIQYNRQKAEGIKSQAYSGIQQTYEADYPPQIIRQLNRYRLMKVL